MKPPKHHLHEAASLQLLKAAANTVWDVMCQLDPPAHQGPGAAGLLPGDTGVARPAATGRGTEPSAQGQAAATPAHYSGSNASINSSSSSTAAPSADPNVAGSAAGTTQGTPPAAALPWLALLGRCWCVFAEHLTQLLHNQPATQQYGGHQAQQQQQQAGGALPVTFSAMARVFLATSMGLYATPQSIHRAASMFADREQQELPTRQSHIPGALSATDRVVTTQQQQQQQCLQRIHQQMSDYFRGLGTNLVRQLQRESRALAEAAASSCLWVGYIRMVSQRLPPAVSRVLAAALLLSLGLPEPQACQKAAEICRGGSCDPEQVVLTGLSVSPVIQAYCEQLAEAGMAFGSVPTAAACNNPGCRSLTGTSEQQAVGGKACRCAACHLACYCSRTCQRQHWGAHKPMCKAVQAHTLSKC